MLSLQLGSFLPALRTPIPASRMRWSSASITPHRRSLPLRPENNRFQNAHGLFLFEQNHVLLETADESMEGDLAQLRYSLFREAGLAAGYPDVRLNAHTTTHDTRIMASHCRPLSLERK
jgi:hypothetical protein